MLGGRVVVLGDRRVEFQAPGITENGKQTEMRTREIKRGWGRAERGTLSKGLRA